MKITVLIVIGLMVVMLLILAFSKKDCTIVDPPFDSDESWPDYILRENLVEQDDRSYKVPTREMQQIRFTSYAVRCASSRARNAICIDQAFFEKLKNTYAQAYVLYMNGSAASVKDRGFQYIKSLYYRSVVAGMRLNAAEKACQKAVETLRRSNSGEKDLIKSIERCQFMIAKLKTSVRNNMHPLKQYIRESGAEGRAWYEALEKKHKEKYGK